MASAVKNEFVDKVPEDHHCTICTNVLMDPVLTGCCGQHFCGGCIKNWLKRQKTCPHCRKANFNFMKDKRMKRAIDSLKIYCPNRSKGCDKITALGERNQHLEKCLFVVVSCTKKCGERILRKKLQDHEDNRCLNRRVQCQYCKEVVMYTEIRNKSHFKKCHFFQISCPNNCGHEKIQRKNLAGHQKVCPLEPVKCTFFEAGCTELIPRNDLTVHKASNTEHHLELMMTETVTLKQKANKLELEANTFKQTANAEREAIKHEAKFTKDQLQQLSLKFDSLASCVTKQLGTIDSNPQTQAAIDNIKSSLETMTTMLAPGDTRYYLPLVKESEDRARSASFYIKPGYKMYLDIDGQDNSTVYLKNSEHDHQLEWPMPEMEIELSDTENKTLCTHTICTRCGHTVNRLEGDSAQEAITNPWAAHRYVSPRPPRDFLTLTVRDHVCQRCKCIGKGHE